jgi:SAM-dependent methyltransferase
MNWVYGESDPALMLFTAAHQHFGFSLPEGARVLELGCAETNFLERLKRHNPSFLLWGVDARAEQGREGITTTACFYQTDACNPYIFEPEMFDAVLMLGAIEHFGLGFYGDPLNEDGDTRTMENVVRWLKPGGWVYFDVPCQPTFSITENRHFRMYSPSAITERLLVPGLREIARAYSEPEPTAGTWVPEPQCPRVPYWFAAVLAEKVA